MIRSRKAAVLLLVHLVATTGCYTLTPVVNTGLPNGTQVALRITDAGRVVLGGSMGPEIDQIEGRLLQHSDSTYVLSVTGVRFLRGGEQRWNGERITVRNEHVSGVSEQQLSKFRTGALAAASVAVVIFAVSKGIGGFGNRDEGKPPKDTAQTIRIPHY
ncbi:MAG: hypothetical protein ABIW79_00610 [Gemmatimonas sp.]